MREPVVSESWSEKEPVLKNFLPTTGYIIQYDPLYHKDLKCMVCQKHTKKIMYFALNCLCQVCLIINLAGVWQVFFGCKTALVTTTIQ